LEISRIRFRQSGGFAGLVRGCELAGADLSAAHRRALARYLSAHTTAVTPSSAARDLQVYELEIDTDTGPMRLEFDESGVPAELTSLLERLESVARPMRP
jgi:hypothetical protein